MLYHKDVFAPAQFFRSPGKLDVRYTMHALRAASEDRYGNLTRFLNSQVNLDDAELVEVEVEAGRPVKWVARFHVDGDLDLVMVIMSNGTVKTVWGNLASDKHRTLQTWKYVQPGRYVH